MRNFTRSNLLILATPCCGLLLVSACSQQNPVNSTSRTSPSNLSTTFDVDFEATAATSDPATRTFTFQENVEVKGLPRMGDTLLIVRMHMDNN